MSNPWDVPPFPSHFDARNRSLYEAVGRAMTRWERFEIGLMRLYWVFTRKYADQDYATVDEVAEYENAIGFNGRADVLEWAAKSYFARYLSQGFEGDFDKLIGDGRLFASRRNDIAHGIVEGLWEFKEGEAQFYWLRPWQLSRRLGPRPTKKPYTMSSVEINKFSAEFQKLEVRADDLFKRLSPPSSHSVVDSP